MDWVKFNVDMSGYYMVHYAGGGWGDVIDLLRHNHTVLTSNDRASLVHDAFQLVGSVTTTTLQKLQKQKHGVPEASRALRRCVAAWGR